MNPAKLAEDNIREFGEYVSVVWVPDAETEIEITNVEMYTRAKKLGSGLKKLGVKRGDSVMVLLPTCPEILACFKAIPRIGAGSSRG